MSFVQNQFQSIKIKLVLNDQLQYFPNKYASKEKTIHINCQNSEYLIKEQIYQELCESEYQVKNVQYLIDNYSAGFQEFLKIFFSQVSVELIQVPVFWLCCQVIKIKKHYNIEHKLKEFVNDFIDQQLQTLQNDFNGFIRNYKMENILEFYQIASKLKQEDFIEIVIEKIQSIEFNSFYKIWQIHNKKKMQKYSLKMLNYLEYSKLMNNYIQEMMESGEQKQYYRQVVEINEQYLEYQQKQNLLNLENESKEDLQIQTQYYRLQKKIKDLQQEGMEQEKMKSNRISQIHHQQSQLDHYNSQNDQSHNDNSMNNLKQSLQNVCEEFQSLRKENMMQQQQNEQNVNMYQQMFQEVFQQIIDNLQNTQEGFKEMQREMKEIKYQYQGQQTYFEEITQNMNDNQQQIIELVNQNKCRYQNKSNDDQGLNRSQQNMNGSQQSLNRSQQNMRNMNDNGNDWMNEIVEQNQEVMRQNKNMKRELEEMNKQIKQMKSAENEWKEMMMDKLDQDKNELVYQIQQMNGSRVNVGSQVFTEEKVEKDEIQYKNVIRIKEYQQLMNEEMKRQYRLLEQIEQNQQQMEYKMEYRMGQGHPSIEMNNANQTQNVDYDEQYFYDQLVQSDSKKCINESRKVNYMSNSKAQQMLSQVDVEDNHYNKNQLILEQTQYLQDLKNNNMTEFERQNQLLNLYRKSKILEYKQSKPPLCRNLEVDYEYERIKEILTVIIENNQQQHQESVTRIKTAIQQLIKEKIDIKKYYDQYHIELKKSGILPQKCQWLVHIRNANLLIWYCVGKQNNCQQLMDQKKIYGTNPYLWDYMACIEGMHAMVNDYLVGGIYRLFDGGYHLSLGASDVKQYDYQLRSYIMKNQVEWVRYYTALPFSKDQQKCGHINEQLYFCRGINRGCKTLLEFNQSNTLIQGGEIVIIKNKMFKIYHQQDLMCLAAAHYGYAGGTSYSSKYGYDINEGGFYSSIPYQQRDYIQTTQGKNKVRSEEYAGELVNTYILG